VVIASSILKKKGFSKLKLLLNGDVMLFVICDRCNQYTVCWHIGTAVVWIHAESWQGIRHANSIHGFKCLWRYTRMSGLDFLNILFFSANWWQWDQLFLLWSLFWIQKQFQQFFELLSWIFLYVTVVVHVAYFTVNAATHRTVVCNSRA